MRLPARAATLGAMRKALPLALGVALLVACGGSKQGATKNPAEAPPHHACGEHGKEHFHELDQHQDGVTEAMVPCADDGKHDYSGKVKVESTPEGIHIVIDATDDEFKHGAAGTEVKGRDAVIVYPKGPGSKAIEVPLTHTAHGYHGEKTIPYEELDKLHDDGTKLTVAIHDHDEKSGDHEELKVEVRVSTGKSCEKAQDENPQSLDMGKKGGASKPDLTDSQLGAPMRTSAFFSHCGLKDSENVEICAAVKHGKPLGVSVAVSPTNKRTAACIDRAVRKLHWPDSEKLDTVKQKF